MNYSNIYDQLIQRAKLRTSILEYENHHILPKSLGGPNTKNNLVKLTLREHFLAHRLLTKMFTGEDRKKMYFAYYRLSNRHKIQSSRFYAKSKQQAREYLSQIHSGKTLSDNHRLQIKNRTSGKNNPMHGKKHSETALAIMKESKIGNTNARVGVKVLNTDNVVVYEFSSIAELVTHFNISRGQAEHYIYNKKPFNDLIFERVKIITRR
jgi:hypothetical protein